MISLILPTESWVAKWNRMTQNIPGIYAIAIPGQEEDNEEEMQEEDEYGDDEEFQDNENEDDDEDEDGSYLDVLRGKDESSNNEEEGEEIGI